MFDESQYYADQGSFVGCFADDDVTSASRVPRKCLLDAASKDCRFDVEHIKVVLIHLIVGVLGQCVPLIENRTAYPLEFFTGHYTCTLRQEATSLPRQRRKPRHTCGNG